MCCVWGGCWLQAHEAQPRIFRHFLHSLNSSLPDWKAKVVDVSFQTHSGDFTPVNQPQDKLACAQCLQSDYTPKGQVCACVRIFKCANCFFRGIVIIVLFQYFDTTHADFSKRLLVDWVRSRALRFGFGLKGMEFCGHLAFPGILPWVSTSSGCWRAGRDTALNSMRYRFQGMVVFRERQMCEHLGET